MPVRAADEIREAILSGALVPGTRIKQEELAARLGVSREPVRQALLLLQREGLVSTDPGRTAAVTSPDRRFVADVYEFREVIDGLVAATVAKLAAPDLTRFDEIVARGREAVRLRHLRRLIELDIAFHTGLYEAANNRVLIDVMRDQWNHIGGWWRWCSARPATAIVSGTSTPPSYRPSDPASLAGRAPSPLTTHAPQS